MSSMENRISRLEQLGGDVEDIITIVYVALEPSRDGPIERKPIGLAASGFKPGRFRADLPADLFVEREPGETVEALIARAAREHSEVFTWITHYETSNSEPYKHSLRGRCESKITV